ncbi:MAG: hypothetical protein IJS15_12770 [Victivallales bacterium]|nr:hypothetical protein [Victivallales bacterium]
MFDFSLHEMNQKVWDITRESEMPQSLPGDMAEGIARDILNTMPEDADISSFVSLAMSEIAQKLAIESEKTSVKIPTAQELLAYTGAYSEDRDMLGFSLGPNKKDIVKKLINSRYDLSDFADITYSEEHKNEVERIVIAAAHKGKMLQVEIRASDDGFDKILKKCTMH